VVSLEVVEHLFYPKRLFEQSRKILVNGGALIVSTPYHGYLKNLALSLTNGWDAHFSVHWDGGHIKFFSKKTLVNMASREGFANIRFYSVGRLPGLWKSIIMIADKKLSE
jgi:2-polyprenyl-3-methyl-5-hydroxy-6-metoxy-1,4-benzoquinol methylase